VSRKLNFCDAWMFFLVEILMSWEARLWVSGNQLKLSHSFNGFLLSFRQTKKKQNNIANDRMIVKKLDVSIKTLWLTLMTFFFFSFFSALLEWMKLLWADLLVSLTQWRRKSFSAILKFFALNSLNSLVYNLELLITKSESQLSLKLKMWISKLKKRNKTNRLFWDFYNIFLIVLSVMCCCLGWEF
jgi:hypothetical protein